jgi:hypothetical protein
MQPGQFALVILSPSFAAPSGPFRFSASLVLFRSFVAAFVSSGFVLYIMKALA